MAKGLVTYAKKNGSQDNISVLVLKFKWAVKMIEKQLIKVISNQYKDETKLLFSYSIIQIWCQRTLNPGLFSSLFLKESYHSDVPLKFDLMFCKEFRHC